MERKKNTTHILIVFCLDSVLLSAKKPNKKPIIHISSQGLLLNCRSENIWASLSRHRDANGDYRYIEV